MAKKNVNILHEIFTKFDIKKQGVLAVDDFKTCFL
jgi:Ca2+-binding EF-hand superfamily protein